ncbi:MAG: hypothetical protein IE923_02025 [Micrococcales bacterium]|nr:hypothetical protein [Micrococcales bacterium]
MIAAALVLALAVGGTILAAQSARAAAAERERVAALEQAQVGFADAAADLSTALDAAAAAIATTALAVTAEEVTDAATLDALQHARGELAALVDSPPAAVAADTAGWDTDALNTATQELAAHTAAATAATTAAVEAVQASHDAWVLERATGAWTAARAELATSLESARALLDSTNEQVADVQTRFDLTAAIDAAQAVHDGAVDDKDPAVLDAAAAAASARVVDLQAVSETVSASHTQWKNNQKSATSAKPAAGIPSNGAKVETAPKRKPKGDVGAGGGGTNNVAPKAPAAEDNRSLEDLFGGRSPSVCTSSNGDVWDC